MARRPGAQPAEDRRRGSPLAVGRRDVGTLAPLPPMGLAPLPADSDQVMQMQVGSEREQVSVPRDEGRASCVYAHRRDMEEVAVK